MFDDYDFALCLTHDVDRVRKTFQGPYYALKQPERRGYHLRTSLPDRNPYWQFERIMELEDDLGVRSSFYFLQERELLREMAPKEWLTPRNWMLHRGIYDVREPAIAEVIRDLDAGGWEVGLHGSYGSYDDRERLAHEKAVLEDVLGHPVRGIRQHHLNLTEPPTRTWEHHAALGFEYDASLGSSRTYGFGNGYGPLHPFDDEFTVFPLTLMEVAMPTPGDEPEAAWAACESLLHEARDNGAVMTVLWHPRYFSERDFPGYADMYRRLIERAQELNAWVGPLEEAYDALAAQPDALALADD
ncbi:polysaccharide deacetylase family protein [Halobium salinum]|uniref:Polysaccharide deacetylase family protein n=1 Tax=Halobium salinum TaxID=1364940 RepID=A0ABD5PAV2_9EURY|nr:polysaccharide deacetylase family protein [Halobium salinum]